MRPFFYCISFPTKSVACVVSLCRHAAVMKKIVGHFAAESKKVMV